MAVARGSAFVRVIFVLVVGALVVRLGWQTADQYWI
jgi:Tfp pilus assembly protein PilO